MTETPEVDQPAADTAEEVAPAAVPEAAEEAAPAAVPEAEETVPEVAEVAEPAVAEDTAPEAEETAAEVETPTTDEVPAEDPSADVPAAEAQADEAPADETAADETAADEVPVDEVAAAEVSPEPEAPAAEAPAAEAPAKPVPTPATVVPKPSALPRPRQLPRPGTAATAAPASVPTPVVAPPADAAEAARASTFGRVAEDGTVYVTDESGERAVGQMPEATAEEALAFYVRRYLDLNAKVSVFEARLGATDLAIKEIDQTLAKLTEETAEPSAVGDLPGLRSRLDALREIAAERRAAAEAARAAAKEEALAARTALIEEAEAIAARDPERMQWKQSGEALRVLLDRWKAAQQSGPRIDRTSEDALWKRFSAARTTFDRQRRHYFSELETRNSSAKRAKEELVAEAEKLQSSTEWGPTTGAYRDLMTRWKAAGRASRKDDDALWARFRAAQDAFFAARDAANAATDEEYRANLAVKEQILTEAEKLVPVKDLQAAKTTLRQLQDRWDAAGKVPRNDVQRIEGRMRAVEQAVRDAEQTAWKKSNPETRARAEGAAAQLEQAIANLEAELADAEAAGNKKKIAEARAALDARRAWLTQIQKAAADS